MKFTNPIRRTIFICLSAGCWSAFAADITYNGVSGGEWATGTNWSSAAYPSTADVAFLDTTANLSVDSPNNIQGIRVGTVGDGRLQIGSRGSLSANASTSVTSMIGDGSGNTGTVQQEGGAVAINRLAIGGNSGSGTYHIHSGTLSITRESGGYSLFLAQNGTGDGTFRMGSGSFTTRAGVQLGSAAGGIGRFEVIGSYPGSIAIGSTGTVDGRWTQYGGSILSVRIDKTAQGVTPIFIDDYGDDGGGDVVFENGALLDVDFTAAFLNGGTYTVMEWEGSVTDNGLQFASSVDPSIWSFNVDAANKRLTVTAVGSPLSRNFVHPGLSHKLSDLDRMRDMVAAGIEPYASSFAALSATGWAQHTYQPSSAADDLATNGGTANNNALRNDGIGAYYNALMWYITGDSRHAEAAIRVFTAWSGVTNIDGIPLNAGRHWRLIEAAEIIKSTYDGWDPADLQAFSDMLVYPGYSNTTEPSGNRSIYWRAFQGDPARHGNQGLFAMRCVMAIGVFLDNEIMYDRALRYLQGAPARSDDIPYVTGPSIANTQIGTYEHFLEYSRTGQESTIADYGYNEVIHNYIYPNGQSQEFSRDMAHGLAGIGIIATMSEMAWSQGDDLYGYLDNRPLLGLEYYYRYNLSFVNTFPDQTTPWEPTVENGEFIQRLDQSGRWFSLKANPYLAQNVGPDYLLRGTFNDDPMYEMNLAHYRDRIGVAAEDTKWLERGLDLLIADQGFEQGGTPWDHPSWGGLTFRRQTPGDPIQGFVGDTPNFAMNTVSGPIEAENYDYFVLDGEGHTYHDLSAENSGGEYRLTEAVDITTCSEGGYALTSIEDGEWITYTVSVPASGNHSIRIRYAAAAAGGKIKFSFDGVDATGEVVVPYGAGGSTGVTDWQELVVAENVNLTQGVKQLKISFSGTSHAFLLNNFSISRIAPEPVAHWAFDDGSGTIVLDSSGNGHHATMENAVWISDGENGALDFNGSSSKVTLPGSAFSGISNQVTVSFWAYGGDTQPADNSAFYAVKSGGGRILNAHLPWSDSKVYWDAGDTGYDRISKTATEAEFKGSWTHWVFSKNSDTGNMRVYRNGTLWHSGTGKTKTMTQIISGTVGGQASGAFYDGSIDDVRLYDVELSDSDVSTLYGSYAFIRIGEFTHAQDVGAPSLGGSALYANGIYTVTGGGNDIYDTVDNFHFLHGTHSGDGEIITQVISQQNTNPWAKAGVMFRETADPGSRNVFVGVRPDKQVTMQYRDATDGSTTYLGLFGGTADTKWIKLTRSGNLFTGWYSIDGLNWTVVDSVTLVLPSELERGLAVTSHDDSQLSTAQFNMLPPAPEALTAVAVDADEIDLEWASTLNADGYNLKRAPVSGGPYVYAAEGVAATNYTDAGRTAGTEYFYVVCGTYLDAEGNPSVEVSAIPSPPINPDDVILGPVDITSDGAGGYNFNLSIASSVLGHNYRVLMSDDLVNPIWMDASDVFPGNGSLLSVEIPMTSTDTNKFYKLETWRQ